jgi:tRNA A-37 threonylcarbamoyl transferase component Bud32
MWIQAFPPSFSIVFQVAKIIGRMHQAGISHPDLTVQNIMVISDSRHEPVISIIDFDGAAIQNPLSNETCMRQLRRLDRSFLKWIPETSPWQTPMLRFRFAAAYCQSNPGVRPLINNYIRKIRWYMFRYRTEWRLQKILKGN